MNKTVYSAAEGQYEQYVDRLRSKQNRRCIDNTVTGCNKCVGYCQYEGHPGFLTEKLRRKHNCIGKQCFYYVAKPQKKMIPHRIADITSAILPAVHQVMCQNEYARVIRVEKAEFGKYNAYYVSITNECDFAGYALQIQKELGVDICFIKLDYDFDKCVALLCAG